jgi:WD40 repeat protein
VAFRPDGRTALSVSQDEFAILWDISTEHVPNEAEGLDADLATEDAAKRLITRFDTNVGLLSVAVSPDGRTALLGTLDNRVLLLNLETGQIALQLRGHTARVLAAAFTPDGRGALSGAASGALRLWNLYNGAEMRRISYTDPSDPAAAAVAVSPDGQLGLTGLWTGEISLWDYASGQEIRRLRGHTEMVFGGVHFLPRAPEGTRTPEGTRIPEGAQGRRAVSGAGDIFAASSDNTVRVWDLETGEELLRLEGHTDKLWDIDVSADGRFVASGSHDGTLRLWDISTEPAPRRPPSESRGEAEELNAGIDSVESRVLLDVYPQGVRCVAFSPDGRFLVAGFAKGQSSNPDYSLHLLETETGREVRRLVGHQEVVGDVAFSPDGRLILSGSNELAILWDAASGVEVYRLTGHAASVIAIAFSPDGRLAVSGAVDSSLLLWDVEAGIALRRYVGLAKPIVGVVFVPDGRSFFVAADDDAVHEYRVDTSQEDLLTWIAANRYVPELTCQQRERYRIEPLCEEVSAP